MLPFQPAPHRFKAGGCHGTWSGTVAKTRLCFGYRTINFDEYAAFGPRTPERRLSAILPVSVVTGPPPGRGYLP
jgi:hypothetical protein